MDSLNLRLGSANLKIPLVILPLFAVLFLYAFFSAAVTFSVGVNNPTSGQTLLTSFMNINVTTDQAASNCSASVAYIPSSLTIASNATYIKSYMNSNFSTNQSWYFTNFTSLDGNYAVFAACNDTTSEMQAPGLNVSWSNTTASNVVLFSIETNFPLTVNGSFAGNATRQLAAGDAVLNGSTIAAGVSLWNITINGTAKNVSLVISNDTLQSDGTANNIYYFSNTSQVQWGIVLFRPFNATGKLNNNNSFATANGWYNFEVRVNDTGLRSQQYSVTNYTFLLVTGAGTIPNPVTVNVTGGGGYLTMNYTFADKFVDYCRMKAYSLSNTSYSLIKNGTITFGNCTTTVGYDELLWPGEYIFENTEISKGGWNVSSENQTNYVFTPLYTGWNFLTVLNNETLSNFSQRSSNISFVNIFNNTINNKTYYSFTARPGVSINSGIDLTYGDAVWVKSSSNTGIFRNYTIGKGYYPLGRNITIWNSGWNQVGFLNYSVTLYQKAQEGNLSGTTYVTNATGFYFQSNLTTLLNKISYYDASNLTSPYFSYIGRNVSVTQNKLMYKGYAIFVRTNMTGNNNSAGLRIQDV